MRNLLLPAVPTATAATAQIAIRIPSEIPYPAELALVGGDNGGDIPLESRGGVAPKIGVGVLGVGPDVAGGVWGWGWDPRV